MNSARTFRSAVRCLGVVALLLTAACYNERVGLDFEGTTDATIGVPFRLTIVTNGELAPSFVDAVYRCQGNVLVPLPGERQAGLLWERSSAAYNTSVIAGTPTDVGRHCFRLVVDRTNEPDKSFDVTITVHPKLIALSPGSLQSGAGNFTLQVAGQGFGTVGGESSRALWNGAARPTRILSATQLEADIPATDLGQAGTVQVTVDNGFEGGGLSNALAFEVSASPVPSITTATLPTGAVGQPYSATLQAAGGTGALAWSLTPTSETLPPGLNLSAGGVISGTPTSAGTRTLTVQVQDSASPPHVATRVLVLDVLGTLQLAGAALPNGTVGPLYRTTLQVTGGLAPLGFSVVGGTLPPGLGLDAATGVLEGNATTGGRYDFSLQVQDASVPPAVATRAYTVLILEITTTALPDAAVGQPYSLTLAVIGQVPPSTWAAAPGTTLPPGIGVTSAGTLTGTPTTTGVFLFSVEVTDSDTPPRRTTKGFSLTVENPRPVVTALVPSSMPPASPAFTLTVDGQGFLPASEVRWNGVARATSFVNATRLTASIAAADVASAGTASVTVSNPSPGGGPSNALTFTIGGGPGPGSGPGVTDLVSQSSTGVAANAPSAITGLAERLIAISANGNRVAFSSEATNLDSPHPGVFVRDIALGATRRVSSTLLDATPNSIVGESLAISADGLWVAFESRASNHVNGDTGQDGDIFVVQSCLPHVPAICPAPDWVSVMPDGTEPLSGASSTPSLSATGRFVAFSSNSPLTGVGIAKNQVFLRDRDGNVTSMLSLGDLGSPGFGDSLYPAISGTGRFIAFVSDAPDLVPDDTNGRADVFVADTCFAAPAPCTPGIRRVSVATGGVEATGASMFGEMNPPAISEDGRFVVFTSTATNLVTDDTNGLPDVFLHDTQTVTTTRVSLSPSGGQSIGFSGTVSEHGRFVAFESGGQVLVHDTCRATAGCTASTFIVSRVPGGATANASAQQPVISSNGQFVGFSSTATNLLPGVATGMKHVYRANAGGN